MTPVESSGGGAPVEGGLIAAAMFAYCGYNDGSGDDGNPVFALIQIEGNWTAVCALHAQAAATGEIERNWAREAGAIG